MDFAAFSVGGNYFKADEHLETLAILWEVKSFVNQAPSKFGPKPAVNVDLTVFQTQADLDAGTPSATYENAQIQNTVLVKNLQTLVGKATIAGVTTLPPLNGNRPAFALEPVSKAVQDKVIAWAKAREDEIQAAAAAAPDFD